MSVGLSADTLLPRDEPPWTGVSGLSPQILSQSARRLRILALQYTFVFFMSDPLLAILFPEDRAMFLASALRWVPATVSISTALLVALLTFSQRVAVGTILDLGLEAASTFEADRAEQSRAFDQLILAYLEKRPDQRPSTADTLAARLAGIEAAGSWSQHLARQWWDEHHPRTRQ